MEAGWASGSASGTATAADSVHRFTVEAAQALSGPRWLTARRTAFAERFLAAAPPTTAAEEWRYSAISEFDLAAYSLPDGSGADLVHEASDGVGDSAVSGHAHGTSDGVGDSAASGHAHGTSDGVGGRFGGRSSARSGWRRRPRRRGRGRRCRRRSGRVGQGLGGVGTDGRLRRAAERRRRRRGDAGISVGRRLRLLHSAQRRLHP